MADVFEYRSIRTKEAARQWVRELLIFIAVCSGFVLFRYRDPYEALGTELLASVIIGVPIALVLWGIYRALRFALK